MDQRCSEGERILHVYGESHAEFQRHVDECPRCKEFCATARALLDLYRSAAERLAPSKPFVRPRRLFVPFSIATAAAAALLLCALLFPLFEGRGRVKTNRDVDIVQSERSIDRELADLETSARSIAFSDRDEGVVISTDDRIKTTKGKIARLSYESGDGAIDWELQRIKSSVDDISEFWELF